MAFKNIAPFRSWISNINSALIDNAEDLDIVKPMYNLLEDGIVSEHQDIYEIIIETKLMMLVIRLQMVKYLNIK